jgi:plasmid stability protein
MSYSADGQLGTYVDFTCSTQCPVVMAKRNVTVQLDDTVIRQARIVAARRGLSLSALVAQQLTALAEADERYERARAVALDALTDATGGGARSWRREALHER